MIIGILDGDEIRSAPNEGVELIASQPDLSARRGPGSDSGGRVLHFYKPDEGRE